MKSDDRWPMLCSDGTVLHNVEEARLKAVDFPESFTAEELASPDTILSNPKPTHDQTNQEAEPARRRLGPLRRQQEHARAERSKGQEWQEGRQAQGKERNNHMSTPRTDAAVNAGGNQLLNVATESRTLETELQQAQATLAAVTLERDEARGLLRHFEFQHDIRIKDADEVRAQLAACQSREAKAPLVLGHPATAEWCTAVDAHHAATEADRDQLQAQVGALNKYIASHCEGNDHACRDCFPAGDSIIKGFRCIPHRAKLGDLQPAPAAPDSAKDGARLDHLLSYGLRGMKSDGKGGTRYIYPKNRADIDAAIAATPPKATS